MISKNLMKKSGIYFIGNLSSKIMSALLIPIYAFYINTSDLGYYDLSQTIMGILCPVIVLAIWESILKFVLGENDELERKKILSTSAYFSLGICFILLSLGIIIKFINPYSIRYFNLIITMIILHTLVYIWQYYARGLGENKLYVVSGILSTIISFAFVIIFIVIAKFGIVGLYLAYNIGQLSIIIILEMQLKILSKIKLKYFDITILKNMILFSAPLVLNLVSAWAMSGFGRIIISKKLGVEINGLYSFANKFSLIITMIGSVITMALVEEAILSLKNKKENEDFGKTIEYLFEIFQYLILIATPLIMIFYEIICNTSYYESRTLVPLLLLYATVNTMACNIGSIFQAINQTKYQFITTVLGAIVTIVITFLFIDFISVYSVIVGQVLGSIVMMLARYMYINKFINITINWKVIIIRTLLFIFICIICLKTDIFVNILMFLGVVLMIIHSNRKIILNIILEIKNNF